MDDGSDSTDSEQERARAAHRGAKRVLEQVRSEWGTDTPTAQLPEKLTAATDDATVEDLSYLYVFASRVGGAAAEDPAVARQWLTGWSAARARVPDDGRAALDAGIAFATRLHDAMGV